MIPMARCRLAVACVFPLATFPVDLVKRAIEALVARRISPTERESLATGCVVARDPLPACLASRATGCVEARNDRI